MYKFALFTFKIFLTITLLSMLIIGASSIYLALNRKEIMKTFLDEAERQIDLTFKYTNVELDLLSHFPVASFVFSDLVINCPKNGRADTLLTAKKLSLTINAFNLLDGSYTINNCIIENGSFFHYPKIIDSLARYFTANSKDSSSVNIFLNKFIIKNYYLNIYNEVDRQIFHTYINNALVNLNIKGNYTFLYFKGNVENFNSENLSFLGYPANIEGKISRLDNKYQIDKLNIKYNSVVVDSEGLYDPSNGNLYLKYQTNRFYLKKLREVIHTNKNIPNISGKVKLLGFLNYNFKTNYLRTMEINHSGSFSVFYKGNFISINDFEGISKFSNNFTTHNTHITKAIVNYKNFSASLSCRVKGLKHPVILAEGEFSAKNLTIPSYTKSLGISSNGKVKILLTLNHLDSAQTSINYRKIKGSVNFNINKLENINRISDISGIADLGENLRLNSSGLFDDKPIQIELIEPDIVNVINHNRTFTPQINIISEMIDADYLVGILSKNSSSKLDSTKIININLDTKYLQYMNYTFEKVNGQLTIENEEFEIKNFFGNGFGGEISGDIKKINDKYLINTTFKKINISRLFETYKNFGQSVFTNENISGELTGNAQVQFSVDGQGKFVYPSLILESDIYLNKGKLKGMNKIKKLSKWLRLDQVESIDFQTLQNKIEVSGQCVRIPKMNILSNVINLQLSGEHYFSGNYSYRMKINFSQLLSRRFLNFTPSADDINSNGSINLYLKLSGDSTNYRVELDKKSSFETIPDKSKTKQNSTQIFNPDSAGTSKTSSTFSVEWDELDTLKNE